ncbi:hypothetical protein Q75_13445 [Bacillus coahuilensis p1.1.43]|uniref:DUF8042 domain-containing protein n=1 Tax=Bacillus coahuilensis p1.1.43 TaxID=1150625 RepID=A0A147K5Z5_9BACI|nr:hypothetical protein [Bacillus coahuilensis]KUP05249.1 hypothetical protein Q75_13445 [Bacillus coahuilensis p1.1.43]
MTEESLSFIQQFYDLLLTVEEGFEFVGHAYNEEVSTPVTDRILLDIVSSFEQFTLSLPPLIDLMQEDEQTVDVLSSFTEVLELIVDIDVQTKGEENRLSLIYHQLYPAYMTWKQQVELNLRPYIVQ